MSFRPLAVGEEAELIALWQACELTRPWNDSLRDIGFARCKDNSEVLVLAEAGRLVASVMAGLGKAAVRAAEAWLGAHGVWKINILVRAENAEVRGFR